MAGSEVRRASASMRVARSRLAVTSTRKADLGQLEAVEVKVQVEDVGADGLVRLDDRQ